MKLATALAASILSLATLDARAAAPEAFYTATVQFADLDLEREAGVAKLYLRIKGAARRVCEQQASEQLVAAQTQRVCMKRAVATAIAEINRPTLTDYFAKLGGKPATTQPASVAAR